MESKIITDAQISVSSVSVYWWSWDVRLKSYFAWRAGRNDQNQWIEVDLRRYTKVTRVATQGGGHYRFGWVTNFKILYSLDGVLWQMYTEPRNSNASVKVRSRTC